MAFKLDQVVPWGRSFSEYQSMFDLKEEHAQLRILGCGDGPASFNSEATSFGWNIVSVDPLYQFSSSAIFNRINETKAVVMAQTRLHQHQFLWNLFADPDALCEARLSAMNRFLGDFEEGKNQGRYISGELPKLSFEKQSFDLAVVSHFLFLYSAQMDLDFHIQSIHELLRVAREVRIFPLLDLTVRKSNHLKPVINHFEENFEVQLKKVPYEFQKGGDEMLVINH